MCKFDFTDVAGKWEASALYSGSLVQRLPI